MNTTILYSSRNLELTYVDYPSANPLHLPPIGWCWQVDATFAAWATRAIGRARASGDVSPADEANCRLVVDHAVNASGGDSAAIVVRAASPVQLPPIPREWFSPSFLAATETLPWPSFESDRAKFHPDLARAAVQSPSSPAEDPAPPDVRRPAPAPAKPRQAAPRAARRHFAAVAPTQTGGLFA